MTTAAAQKQSAGEHFAAFARTFCRHTMGEQAGDPFELEEWQRDFFDEALELRADGTRVYRTAVLVIPRKNGKTTVCGSLALYFGGPGDGEHKPQVILAAGSKDQAGELFGHATAFIDDPVAGSPALQRIFKTYKTSIVCPQNGGTIKRVAGDGKLNQGLNISLGIYDELHVWKTDRQIENWKALTTAGGARRSPMVIGITTAGEDEDEEILGPMLKRVRSAASTELERPHKCLTIYRNRRARVLFFEYAIPQGTSMDDVATWKLANPASWRTVSRLAEDLADPTVDEPTKRRLYGNEWIKSKHPWLPPGAWKDLGDEKLQEPDGQQVCLGVDASLNHDTTAVAWAWKRDDGKVGLKVRVFSARHEAPAHEFFDGGKIELAQVEDFIASSALRPETSDKADLLSLHGIESLGYDPRYFNRSAEDLDSEGVTVVEYTASGLPIWQAVQDFYNDVLEGMIVHDGDRVLERHIEAVAGQKTDRGWKLSKLKATQPIDGAIAAVMAVDLARRQEAGGGYVFALDSAGNPIHIDDEELAQMFGRSILDEPDTQEEEEIHGH